MNPRNSLLERISLRSRPEGGFTLVELLISMTVLAVVLAGAYQGLSALQNTSVGAHERLVNLDEARLLMSSLTKDIRTAARLQPEASPFVYADADEVIFYANLNTTAGPSRVSIYVDSTYRLVEETILPDPNPAYPCDPTPCDPYIYTDPPTTRIVGRWIDNDDTLFRFWDDSPTPVELGAGGVPLTADQLKNIKSVEVTLAIRRTQTIGSKATTLINRVRLPNVDYNPLST
jgi:prepilin-type N-terminal cleavage/methylation domain-containing protein